MMLRALCVGLLAFLVACGAPPGPKVGEQDVQVHSGVNTGNGLVSTSISVGAPPAGDPNAAADATVPDRDGTPFTLTTARAFVRRISLNLAPGAVCTGRGVNCDGSDVRLPGPFVADLLAHTLTPALADVRVPAATYDAVTVSFDVAKDEAGLMPGDPLYENTFYLAGTFSQGDAPVSFSVALRFNEDARLGGGLTLDDGAPALLRLQFDVATWFASLPLTQCLRDGDLVVTNGALNLGGSRGGACRDLRDSLKDTIKS
ncbi:MAG TPA: hypothetical protein VFH51_10970, partial [Myxococcota bacterium]|nr:hypothetical protein [Myxococcota bacterium]